MFIPLPDQQEPKFPLGRMVTTPNALESLDQVDVLDSLTRHCLGDWGDLEDEDKRANDLSLEEGSRLLSAYHSNGTKFWIITEADRSSTCVLLPEDY